MNITDINIRDPFVFEENGTYYLYGTRAENFGQKVGGFDVYISTDLKEWNEPIPCFQSELYNLNRQVNWAPEVHKFNGSYYMFATFTKENGLRGTYALRSESPTGPFLPHSNGALTPADWECLDGTLYIDKENKPFLVFCHEHTQILDGTICYLPLSEDLTKAVGEPKLIFSATSLHETKIGKGKPDDHYITDGPFMYRSKSGRLFMIWSTFIKGKYAQCVAKSENDEIYGAFHHMPPLITSDGGHGMIFNYGNSLMLTFHSPNKTGYEHPVFKKLVDTGNELKVIE